jgi:hypothetical protein
MIDPFLIVGHNKGHLDLIRRAEKHLLKSSIPYQATHILFIKELPNGLK